MPPCAVCIRRTCADISTAGRDLVCDWEMAEARCVGEGEVLCHFAFVNTELDLVASVEKLLNCCACEGEGGVCV